jgi:hypothetical protein
LGSPASISSSENAQLMPFSVLNKRYTEELEALHIAAQSHFQTVFILLFPSMSNARPEGTPQALLQVYIQQGLSRKKKYYVVATPTF